MPVVKLSKLKEVFGIGADQEFKVDDDITPPEPAKTYTQEEVDAQIAAAKAAAEAAKVTPPEPQNPPKT